MSNFKLLDYLLQETENHFIKHGLTQYFINNILIEKKYISLKEIEEKNEIEIINLFNDKILIIAKEQNEDEAIKKLLNINNDQQSKLKTEISKLTSSKEDKNRKKQLENSLLKLTFIKKEILKTLTQKSINENHINNVKAYYINNNKEFEVNINDVYFHNIVDIEETIAKNSKCLGVDLNEFKPEILIFLYNIKIIYEYFYKIAKEENLLSSLNEAEKSIKELEKNILPESLNPFTRNIISEKGENVFTKVKLKEIALIFGEKNININRERKKNSAKTTNIQSNALLDELETTILNTIYDFIQNNQSYIDATNGYRDKKGSKASDQRLIKTFIKNEVKPFYQFLFSRIDTKSSIYLLLVDMLQLVGFNENNETFQTALNE